MRKWGKDKISDYQFKRGYTNWFGKEEDYIRKNHGEDAYIEAEVPIEDVIEDSTDTKIFRTHTPLSLSNVTRLVISDNLDSKGLTRLLEEKGFDHIKLEKM